MLKFGQVEPGFHEPCSRPFSKRKIKNHKKLLISCPRLAMTACVYRMVLSLRGCVNEWKILLCRPMADSDGRSQRRLFLFLMPACMTLGRYPASLGLPSICVYTSDALAGRFWRRPAKPMGSPRVGSNPAGVVSSLFGFMAGHSLTECCHPDEPLPPCIGFCFEVRIGSPTRCPLDKAGLLIWK
jgi:hypothetical protein